MFPKPRSCSPLPPHSFPPNVPQNRYKGPHQPQPPSPTVRPTPTKDAQNPPPPKLPNGLDIRIISAASFARIIWDGAQAYQLHVSLFLQAMQTEMHNAFLNTNVRNGIQVDGGAPTLHSTQGATQGVDYTGRWEDKDA
ncbi:hypothetical protein C0995_012078 [Termitomyces sp. Mi166|nr:hypothetical protein C0995_012078 [Termitomyces sp. Mi166\